MGKETHTSESRKIGKENERVDLRKHRKRITTLEEKRYILEMRNKYKEEDLKQKMKRITKEIFGDDYAR
tara:strand:- start:286 stop:492 length:207 start_codon:yes stop_codon:yes gene_type:complete